MTKKKPSAKSTKKATKTPAAKKTAKPTAAKSRTQPAVKPPAQKEAVKQQPAKQPVQQDSAPPASARGAVPRPTVRRHAAPTATPPAPAAAPAAVTTRVVVKCDVGLGNEVYLRGVGPGLSWEHGVHMENTGDDEWVFETADATEELMVKALVNDEVWSAGDDVVAPAGTETVVTPTF